jgi:hypothetical protein
LRPFCLARYNFVPLDRIDDLQGIAADFAVVDDALFAGNEIKAYIDDWPAVRTSKYPPENLAKIGAAHLFSMEIQRIYQFTIARQAGPMGVLQTQPESLTKREN